MKETLKLTGSRCKIEVEKIDNILVLQFLNNDEYCKFEYSLTYKMDVFNILSELKEYLKGTKKKQDMYHETPFMNDSWIISYHMTEKSFPFINLTITRNIIPDGVKHLNYKKHKVITDLKISNKELKTFYKILNEIYSSMEEE